MKREIVKGDFEDSGQAIEAVWKAKEVNCNVSVFENRAVRSCEQDMRRYMAAFDSGRFSREL